MDARAGAPGLAKEARAGTPGLEKEKGDAAASRRDARAGTPGLAKEKGDDGASRRDDKLAEELQLPSEDSESMEADGGRRCIRPERSQREGSRKGRYGEFFFDGAPLNVVTASSGAEAAREKRDDKGASMWSLLGLCYG